MTITATCDVVEERAVELAEFQGSKPTVYTDLNRLLDIE